VQEKEVGGITGWRSSFYKESRIPLEAKNWRGRNRAVILTRICPFWIAISCPEFLLPTKPYIGLLPYLPQNPKHPYQKFPCIFTSNEAWEVKGEGLWEAVEGDPALEPLPNLECEVEEVLEGAGLVCLQVVEREPALQLLPGRECEVEAVLEEQDQALLREVAGELAPQLPLDHDGEEEEGLEQADLACLQVVEVVGLVLSEQGRPRLWGKGRPLPLWRKRPRWGK
jgi:hypothetical protein